MAKTLLREELGYFIFFFYHNLDITDILNYVMLISKIISHNYI